VTVLQNLETTNLAGTIKDDVRKVVGVGSSAYRKVTSRNVVRSKTDPVLPAAIPSYIVMLLDTP